MHDLKRDYSPDIDEIIETFDFERIQSTMSLLDWRWLTQEGLMEIPSQARLITSAHKLLHDAAKGALESELKRYIIATGGLYAEAEVFDEKMYLELSFRLESIGNFD